MLMRRFALFAQLKTISSSTMIKTCRYLVFIYSSKLYRVLRKYSICVLFAIILISVALGFVFQVVFAAFSKSGFVKTDLGVIRGLQAEDGDYIMYMGVPYARVNRSNPFGASLPFPPFRGVFNAYNDRAICPQIEEYNYTFAGSLDCLTLNIYVPKSAKEKPLPVLVYIYGGRYELGFAGRFLYGPKFLVRHDIIVVTLNYRVGPYGFLCLGIPEVPGNQGLKDQVSALKWIKNNIAAFGGDSSKITISGESSGGQNVDFHVMYSKENVFDQAIIGAGAQFESLTMAPIDQSIPFNIAKDLGYKTDNITAALNFLAKQSESAVITSSDKLKIQYQPCVEKSFTNVESFITQFPKTKIDNVKRVSVIISQSTNEYYHMLANEDLDESKYKTIFKDLLMAHFGIDRKDIDEPEAYVRRYYIGEKKIGNAVKQEVINFCSDLFQNYPVKKKIDQYLSNDAKKIYYGMFGHAGHRNFIKLFTHVDLNSTGAVHVDEIGYLFDVSYMQDPITADDQLIIDRITTLWANFVKYGDPTPETTELLPVKWIPVTKQARSYLNIDLVMSLDKAPFRERMSFWEFFENFAKTGSLSDINDNYKDDVVYIKDYEN